MWIRVRLDIGWRDLFRGLWGSLFARDAVAAAGSLEAHWAKEGDGLACLSVRSALDLLFSSFDLPRGSEVLYSSVTIPDMVQVAREHGLVPVPVDLAGSDLHVDVGALRRAITPQSRVLVVAHLFGALPDLTEVLEVAHAAGIFVVEDCAQAWSGPTYRGDMRADASFLSFGAIKTATTLGGSLARVADPTILGRMRAAQRMHPMESRRAYAGRVVESGLQLIMSMLPVFTTMVWFAHRRSKNVDELIDGLTARFPGDGLMQQLRKQPCASQLRLLEHRLRTYDMGRIERRIANAKSLLDNSELLRDCPELHDPRHTFWLFPFPSDDPKALVEELWTKGVDSARYGSLKVVPAPDGREELDCPCAHKLLDHIVFLPCYPELPPRALDRLRKAIEASPALD